MKQYIWFMVVLLGCLLAACGNEEASLPGERVPGIISFYNKPVEIKLPDVVTRGEMFSLNIVTYGGGCLQKGDIEVEVVGLAATVRPYDLDTTPPDGLCSGELLIHTHTAEMQFDDVGQAQIHVVGLREGPESPKSVSLTETRALEVR